MFQGSPIVVLGMGPRKGTITSATLDSHHQEKATPSHYKNPNLQMAVNPQIQVSGPGYEPRCHWETTWL